MDYFRYGAGKQAKVELESGISPVVETKEYTSIPILGGAQIQKRPYVIARTFHFLIVVSSSLALLTGTTLMIGY